MSAGARRGPAAGAALAIAAALAALAVPAARGQAEGPAYRSSVSLRPGVAQLGQPVLYRGRVMIPRRALVRWVPPAADSGAFEWATPAARRRAAAGPSRPDTAEVEFTVRPFATGLLSVPGLAFRVEDPPGRWREGRLPVARLAVVPMISPGDTSATLRPLRGPFPAPWWERVPWRIVVPAVAAVALAALAISRLRRRAPKPAPAPPRPARDPASEALAALAALRARRLPEQGLFDEHALRLTSILRRFLEATRVAPRPGDTTPELVRELGVSPLARSDVERLAVLLAAWDRIKFARAASTLEDARRAEDAVGDLVRRRADEARAEAAAAAARAAAAPPAAGRGRGRGARRGRGR